MALARLQGKVIIPGITLPYLYGDNRDPQNVSTDANSIRYREIWFDGTSLHIHSGTVGDRGTTETVRADAISARTIVKSFEAQAKRDKFTLLSPESLTDITIRLQTTGFGTLDQLQIRHHLEDEIDQILGWSGNGTCTGGDAGGGSLQIHCEVIVPDLAILAFQGVLNEIALKFDGIEIGVTPNRAGSV